VDSIANALAARDLIIHRLLHPVVSVERDADCCLQSVGRRNEDGANHESIMYLEVDRVDARTRRDLYAELSRVLVDVRMAVSDWRAMQAQMRADADRIAHPEGAELLRWFADGAMTLLGYEVERADGRSESCLGLFRLPGDPTDAGGALGAMRYFENGGFEPLVAKADRKSTVHRRVPLDLVVVPIREDGKVTGIGVHAGLWTSESLTAPVEKVPVLRRQLAELEAEFNFDPRGHSGKALRHAISSLPRDLLVNLGPEAVRELVVTAMSLADRPRPTLLLLRSILKGHLFAFVWLPRDELTTRRRVAIGRMIEGESGGHLTNWSVELGDGDLALIRYTLDIEASAPLPDSDALDRQLDDMVRGWEPSVEEALGAMVGPARRHAPGAELHGRFPTATATARIRRGGRGRAAHLRAGGAADPRRAALPAALRPEEPAAAQDLPPRRVIPLSEAVPVFENFGFRVLEEQPTRSMAARSATS
jgi:glutamate dehydrogenase